MTETAYGRYNGCNYGRKCFGNNVLLQHYVQKGIFGRKSLLRPKIPCFDLIRPMKIEDGLSNDPYWVKSHCHSAKSYGRKCLIRPKMSVTAENGCFWPKIPYGRNFGYSRISASLKPFLTVTVFRQKFSFGHTLKVLYQRTARLSSPLLPFSQDAQWEWSTYHGCIRSPDSKNAIFIKFLLPPNLVLKVRESRNFSY